MTQAASILDKQKAILAGKITVGVNKVSPPSTPSTPHYPHYLHHPPVTLSTLSTPPSRYTIHTIHTTPLFPLTRGPSSLPHPSPRFPESPREKRGCATRLGAAAAGSGR